MQRSDEPPKTVSELFMAAAVICSDTFFAPFFAPKGFYRAVLTPFPLPDECITQLRLRLVVTSGCAPSCWRYS
jgi:hypothetical protein